MEKFQPSAGLQPFVKSFMIIKSETGAESRILPATSLVLALKIKGQVSERRENKVDVLPSAMISGLRNQARVLDYSEKTAMFLIAFQEGGASAFFAHPLHELFGRSLPLEDLWRRSRISELEEKLSEAVNNQERVRTVENFLLPQIKVDHFDQLILNAVQKIKNERGDLKVKELLKFFNTSRDPFEKRFRRIMGTSPKQFSQIIRLRNLINRYSPENTLTNLASAAGYFDQAHFIKDFKSFTGLAPRQFFKSTSYW